MSFFTLGPPKGKIQQATATVNEIYMVLKPPPPQKRLHAPWYLPFSAHRTLHGLANAATLFTYRQEMPSVLLTAESSSAVPQGPSGIMAMPWTEMIVHDSRCEIR